MGVSISPAMYLGGVIFFGALLALGSVWGEELPRPRFVVLGQQGVGKSSISNAFLGFDNTASSRKQRKQSPFKIGHGLKSKTQLTSFSVGQWLGRGANITVVDTPGFKDTKDAEFVEELTSVLGDEIPEIDGFLIVFKYKDRFTAPFKRTLSMISRMFGDIWPNVAIVVNFWDAGVVHKNERLSEGVTEESYTKEIQQIFRKQIGSLNHDVPVVFLDSHFSRDDQTEVNFFYKQATSLYRAVSKMPTFECVKRADIKNKLKNNKNKAAKQRKKSLKKQRRLRDQMKALKINMKSVNAMLDFYKTQCPSVTPGCRWGEWSDWGSCDAGKRSRSRPKLVGYEDECEGEDTETEEGCIETVSENWQEDSDNIAYVFGGRLTAEGGEAEAIVFADSADCNAPPFPEWRQRMAAAYAPGLGMMACGGLTSGGDPSVDCWIFTAENKVWTKTPNSGKALSGGVAAWYKGEFWLLGGTAANESDKPKGYKQKLIKEGLKYNPGTQTWNVLTEGFLSEPVQDACMVNVEDGVSGETLVITGGTDKKIQFEKKIPGKQTSYMFNEATGGFWQPLPEMKKGRASHSCSVATIGGELGIVVAGGSNDGDTVEFLDWDEKKRWVKIPRMGRQRRIGPGMAFIRGKLAMIGGYTWPEPVNDVETFDTDDESWSVDSANQDKRFNHVALTIPYTLLPTCPMLPVFKFGMNMK